MKTGTMQQAKEPWQMTQAEWIDKQSPLIMTDQMFRRTATSQERIDSLSPVHRDIIELALKEGKPVPPEVLKDYPELVKQENGNYASIAKLYPHIMRAIEVAAAGKHSIVVIGEKRDTSPIIKYGDSLGLNITSAKTYPPTSSQAADIVIEAPALNGLEKNRRMENQRIEPEANILERIRKAKSLLLESKRGLDESRKHSVTITPSDPRVKRWMHDQGSADVIGIDTKRNKTEHIGNVSIREVPSKKHNSRRKAREYKPHPPKHGGTDLGAGVVQSGRRRHIRL